LDKDILTHILSFVIICSRYVSIRNYERRGQFLTTL